MGLGGISIWQLLIILVIVLLLFGTKRLKNLGSDLGNAVKGFRNAMASADKDEEEGKEPKQIEQDPARRVGEAEPAATKPAEQEKPKV
ncbi:MAG: twin-arginine translocase TatA/TatE family subunit [Bdellovibrio bacteriovorus]